MEGWPYVLAFIIVYIAFLAIWRQINLRGNGRQTKKFWNIDLMQFRVLRKIFTLICCFFIIFLFAISCLLFGIVETIIGIFVFYTISRLYDWYENWQSARDDDDWEASMRRDGWCQVSQKRWEKDYWDTTTRKTKTSVFVTGEPSSGKTFRDNRRKIRRRSSYIVMRKRQ